MTTVSVAARKKSTKADAAGKQPAHAVPPSAELRERIRADAEQVVASLAHGRRLSREQLLDAARQVLDRVGGGVEHLGFAAVMVNNAYWRPAFQQVPFARRLLLLPRCLEGIGPALGLPAAEGDRRIDALTEIVGRARALGYRIQVADGTPLAVRLLAESQMDAILGISCMESLDKAFAKVHQVGVPAMAVPLLADGCLATATDLGMVRRFIEQSNGSVKGDVAAALAGPHNYLPLLREVYHLFEPAPLRRLLGDPMASEKVSDTFSPKREKVSDTNGPLARLLAEPHELAVEWITRGGKRLRPFITAAAYQAVAGGSDLPEAVQRAAVAVEAFHKASLVHDDIEDDDETRYGAPTVHRQHGVEVAVNVGDYLIGLGYRLIAQTADTLGPAAAADQTRLLAETHVRLARGQGCELAWRRAGRVHLGVGEVMRIYALKTSPAFEAALGLGLILGGADGAHRRLVGRFCRYLGVGFQVLNDLDDWREDVVHARPTLLPALAAMGSLPRAADTLMDQIRTAAESGNGLDAVRARFGELGVFERADALVARCRTRAMEAVEDAANPALADLMRFLVDVVLNRVNGKSNGSVRD